jgi:hypothetical protein
MVPPWVPDVPSQGGQQGTEGTSPNSDPPTSQPLVNTNPTTLAPRGRFGGANRSIGEFAKSGDRRSMQKALGHYVRKGYGGHSTATKRMGNTIVTASALYSVLTPNSADPNIQPGGALDPVLLSGKSSDEVMDALVDTICPVNGTQDAEISRNSIKDALSDVLEQFPDANLMEINQQQREYAIEKFVAMDVFRRIDLDIGKTVREKAPSFKEALGRLKEIKSYVSETVSESFRTVRNEGKSFVGEKINEIIASAISETFQVFEGYVQ